MQTNQTILAKSQTFFMKQSTVIGLYAIATIVASLHLYLLPNNTFGSNYTHYNNFVIFKFSFWNLINEKDLYIHHLNDYYDLFKYSPSFALFMAPFAILPDWIGLVLWNLFSVGVLLLAVSKINSITFNQKLIFLYFIFLETLTSLQSAQTNILMVSLFLFAFSFFENNKPHWAALMLMLSVFIKLFGLILFPLFIIYKQKGKFIFSSILWFIVLMFLPLIVVNFNQLIFLYKSWWNMLQNDHSVSLGLSVMGWLKSWFNLDLNKIWVVSLGLAVLLSNILLALTDNSVIKRQLLFASTCIWVIIFNHKAESSTFNIAMVGIAFYYLATPKTKIKNILLLLCFIFTCLSPTDLFPAFLRNNFVTPYVLKAVPCIFIWIHINFLLPQVKNSNSI